MTEPCEMCGADLDGPGNHVELETGAESGEYDHRAWDVCDECASIVEGVVLDDGVVYLDEVYGSAEP